MNWSAIEEQLNVVIAGNTVQDYLQVLILFIVLYAGFLVVHNIIVHRLAIFSKRTAADLDDFLVNSLSRLGRPFFLILALYLSANFLQIPAILRNLLHALLIIVLTVQAAVFLQQALHYMIRRRYLRNRKDKNDPAVDTAVNSIIGVLRWLVWLGALLFLLDNLGVNITTMIASIGITGIAVGMASQAILGDMFSAFAIFLDKPFEVGDFVIVDNYLGTVEHIGIKTTRIRSLFGEQLVFANSDLTKSRIKNYKRLEEPRGSINFMIPFDTPAAKLREAREVVTQTIKSTPDVRVDHVHIMGYGASGYNFEAAFYVLKGNVSRSFEIQHEVYIRTAESLQAIGVIPASQTQDVVIKSVPELKAPACQNS